MFTISWRLKKKKNMSAGKRSAQAFSYLCVKSVTSCFWRQTWHMSRQQRWGQRCWINCRELTAGLLSSSCWFDLDESFTRDHYFGSHIHIFQKSSFLISLNENFSAFHNRLREDLKIEGYTPTHIESNACEVLFYALKEILSVTASLDASQIGIQ